MLIKGSIVNGTCTSFSNEGEGVVHINKEVIFVNGLLIDETADIEILYVRAGINYGKIKKLYNLSKDRITPKCKVCTACGGCCFQNYDYKAQLIYKTNKVKDALTYITKLSGVNVNDCDGMENPYFYRNKTQVPLQKINKKIEYGFYKQKSHKIVPFETCYIEDEQANEILKTIKKLMMSFKIEPYDEGNRTGIIRHILIRTSKHYNQTMVVLVCNTDSFKGQTNFVKELIKLHPSITTVVQNINKRDTNVILGEKERVLFGPGFIIDSLCGLTFRISSKSFFQINPIQTEKLYNYVKIFANIGQNDVVLDAYSGVGTIGMSLAKYAKKVISVEAVKDAVRDGINNAKHNNIKNVEFVNMDATKYIVNNDSTTNPIDVVIMDPPRKGSTKEFLNALNMLKPKKIIYVSCDPNTLARDLIELKKNYKIENVQPVDMFPMTNHIESVVSLKLRF